MKLPPGFMPLTFRDLLIGCATSAPMLGPMLWKHLGLSEDEAATRIKALEKKGLVQFAIAPGGEPSCFIAPGDGMFNPYATDEENSCGVVGGFLGHNREVQC